MLRGRFHNTQLKQSVAPSPPYHQVLLPHFPPDNSVATVWEKEWEALESAAKGVVTWRARNSLVALLVGWEIFFFFSYSGEQPVQNPPFVQ